MKNIILLLTLCLVGWSQQNPSSISLSSNVPYANITVSTRLVGNPGNNHFYYWVITNLVGGQTISPFPYGEILNAPNTLGVGNYVNVTWNSVVGATSYDVLRTTGPTLPNPCVCALATGLSNTVQTYNDQGASLTSYTYAPQGTATITLSIDTAGYTQPRLLINAPINTTLFANLPAVGTTKGQIWLVANAPATSNCGAGGGSGTTPALCYSTGTAYVSVGGGGGGSGVNVEYNGVLQGTASALNIVSCLVSVFGGGTSTISPDTSCLLTIAAFQGGINNLAVSSSGSGTTYTATTGSEHVTVVSATATTPMVLTLSTSLGPLAVSGATVNIQGATGTGCSGMNGTQLLTTGSSGTTLDILFNGTGCTYTGSSAYIYLPANSMRQGYTPGMNVPWLPDVNGTGGATTLNVDNNGAIPVKESDCSTNPSSTDIVGNKMLNLIYTPPNFCMVGASGGSSTDQYNNQTTNTTYTVASTDLGKIITFTGSSAITLTVPTGLGVGFNFCVLQLGTGVATFTASGTTINNPLGLTKTGGQYGLACAKEYATDTLATSGYMQ